MNPLNDEKFFSVLGEVIWGFHVYGRYSGDQKKAIRAFIKRAPGYSVEAYRELFELSLNILKVTIEAVGEAPKSTRPGQKFVEYADVDVEYVMGQLRSKFPEQTDDLLNSHIGMTIYWYYLR